MRFCALRLLYPMPIEKLECFFREGKRSPSNKLLNEQLVTFFQTDFYTRYSTNPFPASQDSNEDDKIFLMASSYY